MTAPKQASGGLSLRDMAATVERLAAVPRGPRAIYVRREAWPALKREIEDKCEHPAVDVWGPFGPALINGVPIIIVDYLPRPWMTDLDMGQLAPKGTLYTEFRADGWPLCPGCGEDELYSLGEGLTLITPTIETIAGCYRCTWQPPEPEALPIEPMGGAR